MTLSKLSKWTIQDSIQRLMQKCLQESLYSISNGNLRFTHDEQNIGNKNEHQKFMKNFRTYDDDQYNVQQRMS